MRRELGRPFMSESIGLGVILMCPDFFASRPLALDPDGFRERMLPERLRCSCLMESSSRHPPRRTGSLSRHRVRCQGMRAIEQVKSVIFERMCQVAITGLHGARRAIGVLRADPKVHEQARSRTRHRMYWVLDRLARS